MNAIDVNSAPYRSNGVVRHYHYSSDPKLGPGIVAPRRIPCSSYACITPLSLSWDSKINDACNNPRYGRLYDCKYPLLLGSHNKCIILNIIDYGTDYEEYEFINKAILDGNVMSMYFIISKVHYGDIDTDDT